MEDDKDRVWNSRLKWETRKSKTVKTQTKDIVKAAKNKTVFQHIEVAVEI